MTNRLPISVEEDMWIGQKRKPGSKYIQTVTVWRYTRMENCWKKNRETTFFEFTAELERENMFEAKTKNGCTDKMEIRLTDTPNPDYKLKKTKSKNWV